MFREKIQEEFGKQIGSVFTQWEGDIQKSKDAEEKLEVRRKNKNIALFITFIIRYLSINYFFVGRNFRHLSKMYFLFDKADLQ